MYSTVPHLYPAVPVEGEISKEGKSDEKDTGTCTGTADSDHSTNPATCHSSLAPKNVSSRLWEKFKSLEKKTDDVTRRSTQKRIKHLQKSIIKKVQEEITLPEDQDILRDHDVKFSPYTHEEKKGVARKRNHNSEEKDTASSSQTESEQSWSELKPYLSVNEHLHQNYREKYKTQSGMEQKIDDAIAQGDFSSAEKISDQLSQREFGTKLTHAFEARDFVKKRKAEEESAKAKKKKKLRWGFQQKQRWETKSNM